MAERASKTCRFQARCLMYPRFSSKAVLAIYKALYCNGGFQKCQRFESADAGVMPDADLLPDGDRLEPDPTG